MKKYQQYDGLIVNDDYEQIDGNDSKFAIIFHLDDERLYYLNETAYQIFTICSEPQSRESISLYFLKEYELEPDDIKSIEECIDYLVSINVLVEIDYII